MSYPGAPSPGDPYGEGHPHGPPSPGYGSPASGTPAHGYPGYGADPAFGGADPHSYGSGHMEPYTPPQSPQTGGWQAMPPQGPRPGGSALAVIGDITVTQTEIITPSGTFPLAGSQWSINDMTHVEERMPQWALVVALVGLLVICVFSLLFLLAKERVVTGAMQVTVRSGDRAHTAMVPVHSLAQRNQIHQQFNYCRSLASGA